MKKLDSCGTAIAGRRQYFEADVIRMQNNVRSMEFVVIGMSICLFVAGVLLVKMHIDKKEAEKEC